ncbi:YIP1 family protein [Streptacidiphilus sp. MAP5-3]|uniref:Yip1 family protein n=1 Tax=unclassified Streptacidiphilus TaxID=2643834 RepID=UPI0035149990
MRLRGMRIGGNRQAQGVTAPPVPAAVPTADPADEPGHTRAFTVPEMPAAAWSGGPDGYSPDGYGAPGYGRDGYDPDGYGTEQDAGGDENVTTYRAGQPHPKVGSGRLDWKALLRGIVEHPTRTFAQMRAHQVWGPALAVSALYGVLATFAIGDTSSQVLHSTFTLALMIVVSSAVGFVLAGFMFGSVTHVLARRLGGDGAFAPTVGLSMLISWLTDVPRLLLAIFLPAGNGVVQLLGWATWAYCAWLFAAMLRQLHDLPWGKALTAAALQLLMLLVVIKLPTLG